MELRMIFERTKSDVAQQSSFTSTRRSDDKTACTLANRTER
jgi:hypothetical protein